MELGFYACGEIKAVHKNNSYRKKKNMFPEISFHGMSTNVHLNAQARLNGKEILKKHRKVSDDYYFQETCFFPCASSTVTLYLATTLGPRKSGLLIERWSLNRM